jgi:hypothetical protein
VKLAEKQKSDNWPEFFRKKIKSHQRTIKAWRDLAVGHKAGVLNLKLRQFESRSYFFCDTAVVITHDPSLH